MLRGLTAGAFGAAATCALAMSEVASAVEVTIGAGAGVSPDYEGSDDYEAVPLWNLRVDDLYHPATFIQLLGPRLISIFCRMITGGSASPASSSGNGTTSRTTGSTTSEVSTRRCLSA
jgi:hypothetical protein